MSDSVTFTLNGHSYSAPVKLGAAPRERVGAAIFNAMLSHKEFAEQLAKLDHTQHAKAAAILEVATKQFLMKHPDEYRLAIMSNILTPLGGAPTNYREIYETEDVSEEVNAIANFFTERSGGKTQTAIAKTSGGRRSAKKSKVRSS